LAAVLPSLMHSLGVKSDFAEQTGAHLYALEPVNTAVLIVIDGLGWSNLSARSAHARFLWSGKKQRIETVRPSTTGAALTTILTGVLPGEHGLIGYRIRDVEASRLRSTLTDWEGIDDASTWQLAEPLLHRAKKEGLRPAAIGRPAHKTSGLSGAILRGATYEGALTIEERFRAATQLIRANDARLIYIYVDELDRAGHQFGWESQEWLTQLEEIDLEVKHFVEALPASVGCALTADHGMIDVPQHKQVLMDADPTLLKGVTAIGGEPRMRYLYHEDPTDDRVNELANAWRVSEAKRAFIWTKKEAIQDGVFGDIAHGVAARIGDVVIGSKGISAYYTEDPSDESSRRMIGQHGGFNDDEIGVPLIWFGAYSGTEGNQA